MYFRQNPKQLKQSSRGFTIVELLIVIVVIGILALLVVTTYGGIQAKARNAHRQSDLSALQTQVEAFYTQNSYYPSRTDLNTASFLTTNFANIDQNVLIDPSNVTQSKTFVATPTAKSYAYAVFQNDGITACESSDVTCAVYTLTATFEGTVNGSSTLAKRNLN